MDQKLAERITYIKPSPTLTLDAEVKAMKAQGRQIVNLGVGEPDFQTPEYIKEAAIKAIRDGFTRYTPSEGILELREAVCEKFSLENNLEYLPDQIVITCGGKHALYNTMQVLFGPGDEVIIPSPYWVTYPAQVLLSGARPVFVDTLKEEGFVLTPEALASKITPKTKGLIINSPSNPTGMLYDSSHLAALAPLIKRHNLWVISDDIYENLVYDGKEFVNLPMVAPDLKEQTVICHGVSKTYSMTGWRIGFLAAPKLVSEAVAKMQSQMTSNPTSIAQKAALAALTGPKEPVVRMQNIFAQRRQLVLNLLEGIESFSTPIPQGAFYVFPDVSSLFGKTLHGQKIRNSDDVASILLKECEVATIPGSGFGYDRAIRLSYATSEKEILDGLERIGNFLSPGSQMASQDRGWLKKALGPQPRGSKGGL
ncbi:MAG: pyridoxal phosphate-dependent aminotransferase [Deltaproteobacteria bacterium]|jgi:aspartate aminotransferase|nr:pyridoxal phosphate-dependent aminotransferase [Deltaproteobacteria bacterium]